MVIGMLHYCAPEQRTTDPASRACGASPWINKLTARALESLHTIHDISMSLCKRIKLLSDPPTPGGGPAENCSLQILMPLEEKAWTSQKRDTHSTMS
ncbi:hypothetical protein NDU88_002027 [Pleurodeles waltl]|uniref:Uncharacterized protein n=1 Tax=Pleurodeles waltl TaxID=8319 RepID=A0AAV7LZR0_PLEWA|nr:hypothetical protein NDU88_002027 [Pleurodeles waltl]